MFRLLRTAMRRRESAIDFYNLGLGLFLILSPWMFSFVHESARMDAWVTGAFVATLSLTAILVFVEWEEWVTLLLGLWMLSSPWLLGFLHTPGMHVMLFVGCAVTYLALLDLWLIHNPEPREPSRARNG